MTRLLPLFLLALLLAGCTSYQTQPGSAPKLEGKQRFFVVANSNDSRGLHHRIVASLRARGLTADSGPRTMLPDDTQAAITYQDYWAWDFGERLVHLQISVHEQGSPQPVAAATYSAKIPGRQTTAEIVDELVGRLVPAVRR
ncbi:MAG: hypothetical protein QG602_1958 [Verrucomicrobiota bacterium]|nr:hypothetical protein [Verrucomicrobiota bacterium]